MKPTIFIGSFSEARQVERTALFSAVSRANTGSLDSLIARGARVDAVDDEGRIALMRAVVPDNEERMQKLLAAAAPVDDPRPDNGSRCAGGTYAPIAVRKV